MKEHEPSFVPWLVFTQQGKVRRRPIANHTTDHCTQPTDQFHVSQHSELRKLPKLNATSIVQPPSHWHSFFHNQDLEWEHWQWSHNPLFKIRARDCPMKLNRPLFMWWNVPFNSLDSTCTQWCLWMGPPLVECKLQTPAKSPASISHWNDLHHFQRTTSQIMDTLLWIK